MWRTKARLIYKSKVNKFKKLEPAKTKSKESKQELPETGQPAGSEENNNNETAQTFLQSLQNKASNKEKTGSKINETLATNTTTPMRQNQMRNVRKTHLIILLGRRTVMACRKLL